jgi:flavodoxin
MILYFSATGNSQYAAEKLANETNDRLISIGVALRDGHFAFDLSGEAYLGFVVPTFAWTLPGAVAKFIEKMELLNIADPYIYGVFTCGESTGHASSALFSMLNAKSIPLNASFDLVMPDNFILWSNIPPEHELNAILNSADKALDSISVP